MEYYIVTDKNDKVVKVIIGEEMMLDLIQSGEVKESEVNQVNLETFSSTLEKIGVTGIDVNNEIVADITYSSLDTEPSEIYGDAVGFTQSFTEKLTILSALKRADGTPPSIEEFKQFIEVFKNNE